MASKGLVCHFYNEEMMLPHFVKHHLPIFDEAVFINHRSTDNSCGIIRELAPHWKIVNTRLKSFDALLNDYEVMDIEENELKTDWKMALNVTEFMFNSNLDRVIEEYGQQYEALGHRAYFLVDKTANKPMLDPVWLNRTEGFLDDGAVMASRNWRVIHRREHGHYHLGRHFTNLSAHCNPDWNILFFAFAPWPEAFNRKLQIQTQIPDSDKVKGYGIQHIQTPFTLLQKYKEMCQKVEDLTKNPVFMEHYNHFKEKSLV